MRSLIAAVSILVASTSLAQDVKYEKYTLPNGLTVILHEDHSLPIAAVNIWYRVGAKDEAPGRSGFAHLYEHLMFMGTQRVPGSDFDILMESGGGSNNASTSFDRTNYFSSGPSSLLPTLLWLDADRLEDLGRMMDQEKLDRQRDIVRNEIRQQVENTPYGKAGEYIYRLMFPEGHPYHNAVYGTHEDLEAAKVTDVKDFFATFYVPSNASLVVAGDFDPAQIKPLIASLYGTLPRGGDVPKRTAAPVKLDRVIRCTMLDKVQQPKILMAWHAPLAYADGEAELHLAGAVLTEGKASRLYKRLVMDDKSCVSVDATADTNTLGSLFMLEIYAKPDADLEAVEKAVDDEIARLCREGPTPDELRERQSTIELASLTHLQTVLAKADKLNEYEFHYGEPNSFKRDLDRFRNATTAGVKDWAARVLTPGARAIVRILPEAPNRESTPRDQRPKDLGVRPFTPPAPQQFQLSGGIPVVLFQKRDLPLVSMHILFPSGAASIPTNKAGLASITAAMLSEGAGDLDSLAFSQAMQSLGADFDAGADQIDAGVSLTVLKRNFDKAASLVADTFTRPRLQPADFERVKSLHLEDLAQQDENPGAVAARVGLRALYGTASPFGWPADGLVSTVEPLTLDDVRAALPAVFKPSGASIFLAGDLTVEQAKAALEPLFGSVHRESAAAVTAGNPADSSGLRVLIVDRPEAVQTVIRFIMPGPRMAEPARVKYNLLSTLLGGSFTSRLNANLREAHGYTYGAGSRFVMGRAHGYFIASSSVKADVTGPSLREFFREFGRLNSCQSIPKPLAVAAEPIPDAEASKARETARQDTVNSFSSLAGILAQAAQRYAAGLAFDTIASDLADMNSVSGADLSATAKTAIPLDRAVLVLVGDKRLILEQIKDLGLPTPQEVSPTGEPVKPEQPQQPPQARKE